MLGDRECVGHAWFKWRKDNGLNGVMRLPRHQLLTDVPAPRPAIADLGLAVGQVRRLAPQQVDGVWGHVWVKALAGGDFRFRFGRANVPDLGQRCARRWTIKRCFQHLKGRGFRLENRHLRCYHKRRKLVALVSPAYAFCLSVGHAADQRTPIARKKHGHRATSLRRHGLNILRHITRPAADTAAPITRQVEALLRWLVRQVADDEYTVKIVGQSAFVPNF